MPETESATWWADAAAGSAVNVASYYDLLPKPTPTTPLLTRDEAVGLLRARFTRAADDFADDKAGPAFISWRGEHRFDWWTTFYWARDYRGVTWTGQGGDDQSPPAPALTAGECVTTE